MSTWAYFLITTLKFVTIEKCLNYFWNGFLHHEFWVIVFSFDLKPCTPVKHRMVIWRVYHSNWPTRLCILMLMLFLTWFNCRNLIGSDLASLRAKKEDASLLEDFSDFDRTRLDLEEGARSGEQALLKEHASISISTGRVSERSFYFNAWKITIPFQLFMYQCLELMNQMLNKMF